jgi:hypothetical protein
MWRAPGSGRPTVRNRPPRQTHSLLAIFRSHGWIFALEPIVDRQTATAQLEELLPLAAQWASDQKQRVLCEGVPLSKTEMADAKSIGIKNPGRVRLLRVDAIPVPAHPTLRAAAASLHFLTAAPSGLALEYGIFVRSDCWRDRALIAHELVHTAQYERLGGVVPFLQTYISQCAAVGYENAPLELEAIKTAERICP